MKKLFFLLLVVNLVIWLWSQREELWRVTGSAQPDFGAIRVIDDAELAARRGEAPAAVQVSPPSAAAPADVEQRVVAESAAPVRTAAAEQQLAEADAAPAVAEGPQEPPSADEPPPADGTPAPPSAEVAVATSGDAAMVPDAAAPESALPEEPAAVEVAQADAVEPGVPPEPLPQEEVTAPAEAVAPGEPAVAIGPPAEAREILYLCEALGPFRDRAAAERISESLQAPLRAVELREERIARTSRYWVLAPVQPDRQMLADYVSRLQQAGVRDAWRIPSGPFAGRLAVGVFQSAANARKHADMLEAQGVAAEVHAPKDEERRYWIDYERPADADAPELVAARSRPPSQIVPRECGRVAGP